MPSQQTFCEANSVKEHRDISLIYLNGEKSKDMPSFSEPELAEQGVYLSKVYRHRNIISNAMFFTGLLSGWCVGQLTDWLGLWSKVNWRLFIEQWYIYPAILVLVIYMILSLISACFKNKFGETLHKIENLKPFHQASGRKLKIFYLHLLFLFSFFAGYMTLVGAVFVFLNMTHLRLR